MQAICKCLQTWRRPFRNAAPQFLPFLHRPAVWWHCLVSLETMQRPCASSLFVSSLHSSCCVSGRCRLGISLATLVSQIYARVYSFFFSPPAAWSVITCLANYARAGTPSRRRSDWRSDSISGSAQGYAEMAFMHDPCLPQHILEPTDDCGLHMSSPKSLSYVPMIFTFHFHVVPRTRASCSNTKI